MKWVGRCGCHRTINNVAKLEVESVVNSSSRSNLPVESGDGCMNSRSQPEEYEKNEVITMLCRDEAASNKYVVPERQGMYSRNSILANQYH